MAAAACVRQAAARQSPNGGSYRFRRRAPSAPDVSSWSWSSSPLASGVRAAVLGAAVPRGRGLGAPARYLGARRGPRVQADALALR
eukprot:1738866-Pyramimonas_sp.AAC.1